jgi:phosphoribosylaminoimidazole-succinocarboxamide synthase
MTKSNDKKFNETLQNLLKTPPKLHKPVVNQSGKGKKKDDHAASTAKRGRPAKKKA